MSYGPSFLHLFRRSATFVDKILKGAKPADLPVEQPVKFELVMNLRTAKELGLEVPLHLQQRADEVIEFGAEKSLRVLSARWHGGDTTAGRSSPP